MSEALAPVGDRSEIARPGAAVALPEVIVDAGPVAVERFLDFFAAAIANDRTRAAYGRAAGRFLAWCGARGLGLRAIAPLHVAAYIRTPSPSSCVRPATNPGLPRGLRFRRRTRTRRRWRRSDRSLRLPLSSRSLPKLTSDAERNPFPPGDPPSGNGERPTARREAPTKAAEGVDSSSQAAAGTARSEVFTRAAATDSRRAGVSLSPKRRTTSSQASSASCSRFSVPREGCLNVAGACSGAAAGCSRSGGDAGGGFRASTTAEMDAALRQRELFGAAGIRDRDPLQNLPLVEGDAEEVTVDEPTSADDRAERSQGSTGESAERAARELFKTTAASNVRNLTETVAACDEIIRRFGESEYPAVLEWVAKALVNKGVAPSR